MGSNDAIHFLAGNPIWISIWTGVNGSTRYRIYANNELLFDGSAFSIMGTAKVDVSGLFEGLIKNAGITQAKMITVDSDGVEYDGSDPLYVYDFVVYGGGISKGMIRKLTALETDIFSYKLKNSTTNFFLTTRTNDNVICIPEDELMPLFYYAKGMNFTVKVDGATVASYNHSGDAEESLQSIDFSALRRALVTSGNKLASVFEICTGTEVSCIVVITEQEKPTNYYLRFLNSWGCWEKIALEAAITFNPAFTNTQIARWDAAIGDYVNRNTRKEVFNSNEAGTGYKTEAERLFIIDLMLSDSVIMIVKQSEYEVNVGGELPALISTEGNPVNVTLKVDLIDKEKYFSDLGEGAVIPAPASDPVYQYRWTYLSSSCLLTGDVNNGTLRTIYKKQYRLLPSTTWNDVTPQVTNQVDTHDEVACPVQTLRWVEEKSCKLDSSLHNTGEQEIVSSEERLIVATMTWEKTGRTNTRTVTNYADCPLPAIEPPLPRQIRVSVGAPASGGSGTGYNAGIEVIYPYNEGVQLSVYCPLLTGYNYAFIEIPQGKTLTIKNSLNSDVTDQWSVVGTDERTGYQTNNIYRSSNVFSTALRKARYYITIN